MYLDSSSSNQKLRLVSVTYGNGKFVAVASSGTSNRITVGITGPTKASECTVQRQQNLGIQSLMAISLLLLHTMEPTVLCMQRMTLFLGQQYLQHQKLISYNSVTYGNGKFVAVAATGANYRLCMQTIPLKLMVLLGQQHPPQNKINGIQLTYGDGKFVAVAEDGTNQIMYS